MTLPEVFSRYVDSKREFWAIVERCSIRGWPDRQAALRNAFRLQELFCDCEYLRFEYLISAERRSGGTMLKAPFSISSISKRCNENWMDVEEKGLTESNPNYAIVVREIEACEAAMDRGALDGPFRAAQQDSEYIDARKALAETLRECDRDLGLPLVAR